MEKSSFQMSVLIKKWNKPDRRSEFRLLNPFEQADSIGFH